MMMAALKTRWLTIWQQRSAPEQRALRWLMWIVLGAPLN